MVRKSINFAEEEELAMELRKQLCLYSKECAQYKDRRAKVNAWRKIEETFPLNCILIYTRIKNEQMF